MKDVILGSITICGLIAVIIILFHDDTESNKHYKESMDRYNKLSKECTVKCAPHYSEIRGDECVCDMTKEVR